MTITATVIDSKHAVLTTPTGVREINHDDVRVKLVEALREEASTAGTRVVVEIEDHLDQKRLQAVVDPNGAAVVKDHSRPYGGPNGDATTEVAVVDATTEVAVVDEDTVTPGDPTELHSGKRASYAPPETVADGEEPEPVLPRRRAEVETVLYDDQFLQTTDEGPWRSFLARFGIRLKPTPAMLARRDDVAAVSQHFPGLRTVLVAGPKGRSNKTLTAAVLAAMFARLGGAGVVAWDNNPNQGTLLWRTEKGPHANTVVDLLKNVAKLMEASAQAGDMAQFLHHQSADLYDVLASDQNVDSEYEMSWDEFDSVHDVVAKYNRMIVLDSGNSDRGPYWKASVAKGDQLVVTVVESKDVIEAAERLLDRLHAQKGHAERLAQNVIVIVSQTSPGGSLDVALEKMRPRAKELVVVPYDESLKDGMIRFDALNAASQRAWLHAAATVGRSL